MDKNTFNQGKLAMKRPIIRISVLTICAVMLTGITTLGHINIHTHAQLEELTDPTFTINAKVTKDRANTFDESMVYYDVKNFDMTVSNGTEICPSNDCTFKYIHEETDGFTLNGISDRTLEGVLKITNQGKTKIFNVDGDFSILEEETDENGKVTKEILEGTLQLYQGDDIFGGDEYQVNGNLTWNNEKNADLILQGIL